MPLLILRADVETLRTARFQHPPLQSRTMRPYDPKPPPPQPCYTTGKPQPGCDCLTCVPPPPKAPHEPEEPLLRYALATEHCEEIAYLPYYKQVCARNFKRLHPRWTAHASKIDPEYRPDLLDDLIFVLYAHAFSPNAIHASLDGLLRTAMTDAKYPATMLAERISETYGKIVAPRQPKAAQGTKKAFGQL